MKKILFISVLLLNFVGFAQEPISKNPPVQYSTKPFGSVAEEGDKEDILKVIDIFMTAVNSKDKSIFDSVSYKGIQRIVTLVDQDKVITAVYDNDTLLDIVSISSTVLNPFGDNLDADARKFPAAPFTRTSILPSSSTIFLHSSRQPL